MSPRWESTVDIISLGNDIPTGILFCTLIISHNIHKALSLSTTYKDLNMIMNSYDSIFSYILEDPQGNGLQYNKEIDNAIIHQLSSSFSIISGELKTRTEKMLGKSISFTTFIAHIDRLRNVRIVNKQDQGRGGKVSYSLTERARKLIKLKLLGVDNIDKIKLHLKIYEKILLYEFFHAPIRIISSEQEFDKLLSRLNKTKADVKWAITSTGNNYDSVELVYGNISGNGRPVDEPLPKMSSPAFPSTAVKEYWQRRGGKKTVLAEIEFICHPIPNNIDFWITKREYWQINKNSKHKKYATEYRFTLPGVSIEEFLENDSMDLGFDRSYIEESFNLLEQIGLIKPIYVFQDETRFKIMDNLRELITALNDLCQVELNLLLYKWKHFDEPSHQEKKRWQWLLSEKEANRIFRDVEMERCENRKRMRECKNVEEYHGFLMKDITQFQQWSIDDMFNKYKIEREQEKRQQEKREQEKKKQSGKRWIRTKKIRGTKKELKDDIIKYRVYHREKLNTYLEYLPANLEEEGVEHFKMLFSKTIEEYPFLHDILKNICPKAFEPDNKELQSTIIKNEEEKDIGTEIIALRLNALDMKNAYDVKNKKEIPYKEYTFYDRITKRTEKIKIPDLTNLHIKQ
jgi:hypothetical protein